MMAGQAEPPLEQLAQARLDATERRIQLLGAERLRDDDVRLLGVLVLDQVAVEAVAARDRSLEADGVLDDLQQLPDALLRQVRFRRDLGNRRLAVQLLGKRGGCASRGAPGRRRAPASGSAFPWSARARVTAWRIHQVAYVESL